MSNYCACSGGDEEYSIELNQQGPEGPQGPVGPEGFSPSISIKTNTDKAYVLTVVNKEGSFDTPNLYGVTEKLNADLSNIPNPAFINGIALSRSNESIPSIEIDGSKITTGINGNLMLSASSENQEGTESFNYEVVVNPKEQHLELHDNEGNVKVVATTDYIPTIGVATTTTAGIVKPDGSTITVSSDGTISAVAPDLSNYVTNDELSVDLQDINSKIASKLDTATYETDKTTYATKEELASTDATVTSIQTELGNKLESSNIIAGANIAIDRSGNNLTINSIGGGGGASIDDGSTSSVTTWSSSKINSEITTAVDTINSTKNDNIFDIGKFTVVGSPIITDDGVASEYSLRNGIQANYQVGYLYNKSWTISTVFKYGTLTDANPLFSFEQYISSGGVGITTSQGITFQSQFGESTVENIVIVLPSFLSSATIGNRYKVTLDFNINTGSYTLSYKGLDDNISGSDTSIPSGTNKQIRSIYLQSTSLIRAAGNIGWPDSTCSIDLKQFSITVDGKEVFSGLMESTKPIYDRLSSTSTELSTFKTDTTNNFSAVNSALNEKANLSDLSGYVTVNKYNELLARVVTLETEINGGNA